MAVREIACPQCGDRTAVRKEGLGAYYCAACGCSFGPADLVSVEQD